MGADGNIFELVENSEYFFGEKERGKDQRMHRDVLYWNYYLKTVQIDGDVFDLLAHIRKKANGGYVYDIELYENKKIEPSSPEDSLDSGRNRVPNSSKKIIQDDRAIVKERFSVDDSVDSDGNELSAEQQEYFRDSKVRDADGRLMVMYHGTPSGNHTTFRSGT